ncbi:MAG: hypothetical protein JNM86_03475 [Phycisphaerae bacterium]|nr:hypothetical protein [Phycisphaerae bacterium]
MTMTSTRSNSQSLLRSGFLALALAFGAIGSAQSRAQDIPTDIVTSPATLSAAQKDTITSFVTPLLESLKSDDANKVRDARQALIRPLQRPGVVVGVPFRQAYSAALGQPLAALADDKRPLNAINAMRVGAELATAEGFDIIEKGFKSPLVPVRVAAAGAASRAFVIASGASSAVVPKRLLDATTALGKLLADPDANVADAASRALVKALETARQGEVRNGAVIALCRGISARAAQVKGAVPDAAILDAFRRAALSIREDLTKVQGDRPNLSSEASRNIQEVAGDLIAMVARLIASNALPATKQADTAEERKQKIAARDVPSQIVGASEQILSLIADKTEPIRTNFAEKVRQGTVDADAQFLIESKDLLTKRLTRSPFNFPADRFDLNAK